MIHIKPSFYNKFKCTSSKCSDNCCIGWEIDVDDETLNKYKDLKSDFGEEIRSKIIKSPDGSNCFKLGENQRCSFLDDDNLCCIIKNQGEDYLCSICREHPRFYNCFPGVTEYGLGLCCEEVCRLLIEEDFFSLTEYNDGEKIELQDKEDLIESDMYIYISALRDDFFSVLSNETLTLEEKLVKILEKLEKCAGEKCKLKNEKEIISAYLNTEPIDDLWTDYIKNINDSINDLKISHILQCEEGNIIYSKVLAYILYRHFVCGAYDGDFVARAYFSMESLFFIMLCDRKVILEKGTITLKEHIDNIKRWSKQVEYSEENTEFLIFGE